MFTFFLNYLASGNLSGVLQFSHFPLFVKQSGGLAICALCTFCQTVRGSRNLRSLHFLSNRGSRNLCSLHFLSNNQRVLQFALFALFVKKSEGLTICALCTFCQTASGSRKLRSLHYLSNSQIVPQFVLCNLCILSILQAASIGHVFIFKQLQALAICAFCTFCELGGGFWLDVFSPPYYWSQQVQWPQVNCLP